MTSEASAVNAKKLADLRKQLYDSDETRIRYRVENDFLRKQLAEAQEREAQMAAVLRPFADIGIGTNPDYEPMIRLPREAILRARAALASAAASPSPVLRDAVIVPREPTNLMLLAGYQAGGDDIDPTQEELSAIYRAMIDTALSRPVSERDGEKA